MSMEKEIFVKGRVSIVTPVYNGEVCLPHMLDSVLRQTYSEIEMILVDDGSTDHTVQIAEDYNKKFVDKGYRYRIVQGEHKNASAAINCGLSYVTGEYLIWPDSDDILEPESIEKRVDFLRKNPQYQCVRTLSYYFDLESKKLLAPEEKTGDLSNEELFWEILEFNTFVCCGCYMLKSECFFRIYTTRCIPEYNVGQNFQMLLPYMYYYRCPTIQEKLYGVCVRKDSHSRKTLSRKEEEQKCLDYENLVDEIADICKIHNKKSQKRILCWKIRRRYIVALKYNCKRQAISALFQLYKRGDLKIWKVLKDSLWVCLENTWIVQSMYPVYWRNLCKFCQRIKETIRRYGVINWF